MQETFSVIPDPSYSNNKLNDELTIAACAVM